MLQKLPIGIQTFSDIINDDNLYVDKTEVIHRLLTSGKYFFLSRPRRSGKSLTLSTINSIYQGERALFAGLWIEEHTSSNSSSTTPGLPARHGPVAPVSAARRGARIPPPSSAGCRPASARARNRCRCRGPGARGRHCRSRYNARDIRAWLPAAPAREALHELAQHHRFAGLLRVHGVARALELAVGAALRAHGVAVEVRLPGGVFFGFEDHAATLTFAATIARATGGDTLLPHSLI